MEYNHKKFGIGTLVKEETQKFVDYTYTKGKDGKVVRKEHTSTEHYIYLQFEDGEIRCFTPDSIKKHLI